MLPMATLELPLLPHWWHLVWFFFKFSRQLFFFCIIYNLIFVFRKSAKSKHGRPIQTITGRSKKKKSKRHHNAVHWYLKRMLWKYLFWCNFIQKKRPFFVFFVRFSHSRGKMKKVCNSSSSLLKLLI